jgi:propanol-preferring alcohol dehydrogenase
MQAAVLTEIGQPLRIEDVAKPIEGEGEVLVKIEASGVCHSDLHLADGDWPGALSTVTEPLILGHEVVGTVTALGPNTDGFAVGDRVGLGWLCETCGECDYCHEGDENICKRRKVTGLAIQGGYAEYFKAKASHLLKVPEGLDPVQAAPLFCAGVTVYRAVSKANLQPGQRVAVFGVGGLGHLAVQLVKNSGAETIAVDVGEEKLELARSLGADHVFSAEEAVKSIRKLGRVHAAVVTAAARPAYDAALASLRKKGTLVVVGLPKEEVGFIADDFVTGEYRILGTAVGTREDIRQTLELAAQGKLQCRTETVQLDQINKTFDRLRKGEVTGRVVLTF